MTQTVNYSASATWRVAVRQTTFSLKKTIQAFRTHAQKLTVKLEQLEMKKRGLDEKAFVVVEEMSVEMSDISQRGSISANAPAPRLLEEPLPSQRRGAALSASGVGEQIDYYHNEDNALVSQATVILMESIKIRLSYVEEAIGQLTILYRENPKMKVPLELTVARYEEWVRTHQRLFELNSLLFDLEKRKFDTGRKRRVLKRDRSAREDRLVKGKHRRIVVWNSQLVRRLTENSYIQTINGLFSYYVAVTRKWFPQKKTNSNRILEVSSCGFDKNKFLTVLTSTWSPH